MPDKASETTGHGGVSRRGFLVRSAATGLLAGGLTAVTLAQTTGQDVRTFALTGVVEAWQGVAPQSIAGMDNPTLELEAGETYRVVWQNGDGEPHNFAIQDDEGTNLQVLRELDVSADDVTVFENETAGNATNLTWGDAVADAAMDNVTTGNETGDDDDLVEMTETIEEESAIQALEFEASSDMATYICLIHPTTMVGDVSVSGGAMANETGNSS